MQLIHKMYHYKFHYIRVYRKLYKCGYYGTNATYINC